MLRCCMTTVTGGVGKSAEHEIFCGAQHVDLQEAALTTLQHDPVRGAIETGSPTHRITARAVKDMDLQIRGSHLTSQAGVLFARKADAGQWWCMAHFRCEIAEYSFLRALGARLLHETMSQAWKGIS